MEKTKMSKKQFVIYMAVAFGLAWILEMIASIFANKGNQMMLTIIMPITMFMLFGAYGCCNRAKVVDAVVYVDEGDCRARYEGRIGGFD